MEHTLTEATELPPLLVQPAEIPPPAVILAGNPNVGKSVIFHWLTGRYATVSNYPGTTVEVNRGQGRVRGWAFSVCDAPGLNSLLSASEDEQVARRLLLGDAPAVAVQVADAKNLERALMLTLEFAEAELPQVLALNMIDEAGERRITIRVEALEKELGIPVVPTIAIQRSGLPRLAHSLSQAGIARAAVAYPEPLAGVLEAVEGAWPERTKGRRAWSLLWLANDQEAHARLAKHIHAERLARLMTQRARLRRSFSRPIGAVISEARLSRAREMAEVFSRTERLARRDFPQRLGTLAVHPLWGHVIAAAVLAAAYGFVGYLGAQVAVDWMEETFFGRWINPLATQAVERLFLAAWLRALLIGEYGLITMALTYAVAIVLPIVGAFFLCFGLLEDSGYLPRLAALADGVCRAVGLNGKAVVPLMLGLGCGTMAVMGARTLESRRDRFIITVLLSLAVPCSAQLGVIGAMLAQVPFYGSLWWFAVVAGTFFLVGGAVSRLTPGDATPFLCELPPLRWPKASNIAVKTLGRVEWYLREAVPFFFLGTLVLFGLDRTGWLSALERGMSPVVVSWLGLPAKTAEVLLVGFLRRDFGAAGLLALQRDGLLSAQQTVVSLVVITLFVPCFAQFLMTAKERGLRTAMGIAASVTAYAIGVGGLVRWALALSGAGS